MIKDNMEKDTGMLLFGLAVLMGLGLLFWKLSVSTGGTTITSFSRDTEGRIQEIIERTN